MFWRIVLSVCLSQIFGFEDDGISNNVFYETKFVDAAGQEHVTVRLDGICYALNYQEIHAHLSWGYHTKRMPWGGWYCPPGSPAWPLNNPNDIDYEWWLPPVLRSNVKTQEDENKAIWAVWRLHDDWHWVNPPLVED